MVDAERLRRILQRVARDVEQLRAYARGDVAALLTNPEALGNLKYLFVTAIEGCVDAAQHVCASERFGPPEDNADAMRVLARNGVLDAEQAEALARSVGFRTVLVHGYRDVDDRLVVENLGRLDDLEAFVSAVARLAD